jgi:hypothetical protein
MREEGRGKREEGRGKREEGRQLLAGFELQVVSYRKASWKLSGGKGKATRCEL